MIGKGKSITHTAAAVNYAIVKEKGEVLDKHLLTGETAEEIAKEFQQFQELNGRCKNNTFSFVISPSVEDGKTLTNKEYRDIAKEFLEKSGLKDHQAIIVKHQDKEHTHLHIFANRIGIDGKAASDHFVGLESQRIADEIAKDRNLTRAKVVGIENEINNKDIKKEILSRFENAIKTHRPRNQEQFFDALKANKIDAKLTINKQGEVQGYRVNFEGQSFKASEIGNKFTLAKLDKTLSAANSIKQAPTQSKPPKLGL